MHYMMAKLVISGSPISVPSITGGDILPPSLRYSSVGPLKPEYLGRKNDGTEIGANLCRKPEILKPQIYMKTHLFL